MFGCEKLSSPSVEHSPLNPRDLSTSNLSVVQPDGRSPSRSFGMKKRRDYSRSAQLVKTAFLHSLVLVGLGGIRLQAQSTCPNPPEYKLLRQDEDYSYLRNDACKQDRWDSLKYMRLGSSGDSFLTIGGEAREWYEGFRNALWGVGPQDDNGYLLQRLSAYGDLHVSPRIRFFAQLTSTIEAGRNGGPRPVIYKSKLWFEQVFAAITLSKAAEGKENCLVLGLGGQELEFGSGRFVDIREGPNV